LQPFIASGRNSSVGGPEEIAAPTAGDAFEEFVRGRSAHLFRLALLLTGWNTAAAEDLVQTALERAYRRRWLLFGGQASPEPYIRRVLVNAAIDWRRWRRRTGELPLDAAVGAAAVTLEDQAGGVADRDLLLRALALLPAGQRAVLVLRYWEDLSNTEIAAVLRCDVGTVKSQASRGLQRLRALTGTPSPSADQAISNVGDQNDGS
jgi:RNA polymerase sigma-70 factor (sigma-E family)